MKIAASICLLLLLISCSNNGTDETDEIEFEELSQTIVEDISVKYAKNFNIIPLANGYLVDLIDPNTHKIERSWEFTYDKSKKGDDVIHLPLENIAAFSQTTIGMMSSLDALEPLMGITNISYVYDPEVKRKFKKGQITEFKGESNFSVEKAINAKADIIIYSGFSREFPQAKKLKKFGIDAIPDYDWRETHPLGRAEWIKFVGVICGKLEEAKSTFQKIESEYLEMSLKMNSIDSTPAVISGNFRGDQWTAPAGNSYMAILFKDAGANYVYKDTKGTGSIFKSMERIIIDNESTNYWLNPGFSSKTEIIEANPKGKHLGPYKTNEVYCYTHDVNLFWERSAVEPHLLLADFIQIFHPEIEIEGGLNFYKKLEK